MSNNEQDIGEHRGLRFLFILVTILSSQFLPGEIALQRIQDPE
jgi:hypothetical protein